MSTKKTSRRLVSAKDIAKNANVSYAAINNYTDMGLLDVVAKDKRIRMYDFQKTKERLNLISRLVSEGYTLKVIGKILR